MSVGGGGGSSSSKSAGSQVVTQTTTPWSGQQPYLLDLMKKAQDAYGATPKTPWGNNPLTVRPSNETNQAFQGMSSWALGAGDLGKSTTQLGQDLASGKYLDVNANPYFQKAVGAATRPVIDAYQQQIVPQLTSQAISGGAYGGDRDGLVMAQSADALSKNLLDVTSAMSNDQYNRERALQLTAPDLISKGASLSLMPSTVLGQVGAGKESYEQSLIDEKLKQWSMAQEAPWIGLDNYASLIYGAPSGSQSTTNTVNQGGASAPGWLTGALGGGMAGIGLGQAFGASGAGGLSPYGIGGTILGGLLGGFF